MMFRSLLQAATLLSLSSTLLPSSVSSTFVQDRFVTSFWVDPIVNSNTDFAAAYAQVAAANFNTVLGGFGATTPDQVTAQLAAAASLNLAVIANTCESATGPGPDGTCVGTVLPPQGSPPGTLMGYQMWDEPAQSDFPTVAAWVESVGERAPKGSLRFVNLLPNYGFPGPNSTPAYEEYVSAFVSTVHPDLLSFDHYPLFGPYASGGGDVSLDGYHRNLEVIRAAGLAAGISFWNFFTAMPFNGRPDVSESQMRIQAYSSLAYGSKGVMYFCYWSPEGSSFPWGGAILTPRTPLNNATDVAFVPGIHYEHATRINAKLLTYGGFLLNSTSTSVLRAAGNGTTPVPVPPASQGGAGNLIASVAGAGAGVGWSVVLGAFSNPTSSTHPSSLLVNNQDDVLPLILTLSLGPNATATGGPFEVDPVTGEIVPAWDDAPAIPGWQVALDAGDARLFVF